VCTGVCGRVQGVIGGVQERVMCASPRAVTVHERAAGVQRACIARVRACTPCARVDMWVRADVYSVRDVVCTSLGRPGTPG